MLLKKMKKSRLSFAKFSLLRPLRNGGSFFVFTYLLLLLLMVPIYALLADYEKMNILSFFEAFADIYIISWALSYLPGRARHTAQSFVTAILLALSVVDVFIKLNYHTFISAAIVRLLLDTNPNEAANFWQSQILCPNTLLTIVPFILWGIAWWYYACRATRLKKWLRHHTPRLLLPVVSLSLAIGLAAGAVFKAKSAYILTRPTLTDVELQYSITKYLSYYSPIHRAVLACRLSALANRQVRNLRTLQQRLKAHASPSSPRKVVLIIGESYNRSHSALYGYEKPTTPLQSELLHNGGLFLFSDVVSCWNLTSYVFQHILSLHSIDSAEPWERFPLLPAVYKAAGYRSLFLTNQFPRRVTSSSSEFAGSFFLCDPIIGPQAFDFHNTDLSRPPEDSLLIKEYERVRQPAAREFVIFSLRGQHLEYSNMYPHNPRWEHFSAKDYTSLPLSEDKRAILAHYDNATRYNDYIVREIIRRFEEEDAVVVYCPDHGELLYDGVDDYGRTLSEVFSEAEMKAQFQIPFWVWCSSRFQASRPELIQSLNRSLTLPFMTDDLPHLMLSLSGISCPYYIPSRSPVTPDYNIDRKRLLRGKQEFRLSKED